MPFVQPPTILFLMTTAEKVYRVLKAEAPGYVSGESLALSLGLSRAAIWKAVSRLCQMGCEIEGQRHHGYRLVSSDDYNELEIRRIFTEKVFFFDELVSTNDEARRLVNAGEKAPFVVIAKKQTGGRGRRGRSFFSPDGGIYLSIVVEVTAETNVESITTAAALGVSNAIDSLGFDTQIKWVNDIYLSGRKVCGILCEGVISLEDYSLSEVVIGIGVNFSSTDFPAEMKDIATSLYREGEEKISKAEFAALEVKEVLSALKDPAYLEKYREKCFILGMPVNVISLKGEREATAIDLDDKAHLVVRYEDGKTEHISSGEVTIRPLY